MKNMKLIKNSFFNTKKLFILSSNFCTNIPKLDFERYVKEVDKTMNIINDHLEELEVTDNITLTDGVLKITLPKNKHYVLNIQRPNQQIWLSSPISGPQRFEFDLKSNSWKNNRNGKDLYEILNEEMNTIIKEGKIDAEINFKH
jgi:frataxin